jgi:hypothetical protein
MREYKNLEMEVITFEDADVITDSNGDHTTPEQDG